MLTAAPKRTAKAALTTLAVLIALGCATATSALADSASISFTDAAGNSDPVADVGRTWTLTGNSGAPSRVWVKYRPAGGAPCAPSANSDSGDDGNEANFNGDDFYGTNVNGNFTLRKTGSWGATGTYMFCIWIASSSSTSTTPITQNVTFRAPSGTISATVAPITPRPNQLATVTATGTSEAPKRVYATIRPAGGAPCAATYSADSGSGLLDGTDVNGNFSVTTTTAQSAGNYLICLWLADSSSDASPIAGPQPITYSVVAPPKACVVPRIKRATFRAAKKRLHKAHCTVGSVRYKRSHLRRGRVVKTSPKAGRHLPHGAPVTVVLSRGRH